MNSKTWRLAGEELRAWLGELLRDGRRVVAPVEHDGLRLFRAASSAEEIDLQPGKTRLSPKEVLFPRTETLYGYALRPEGPLLQDPELPDREQLLFGLRPCDAAGLERLDAVFLEGRVEDPFYARRRERTTVAAVACDRAEPECFCTAVGGSPMGSEGVDLLVVPFDSGWLVRCETEKGQAWVGDGWAEASAEAWSLAREHSELVSSEIARTPVSQNWARSLERGFDSKAWSEIAQRCLSCSICAYVCPSCSCFDVHHEGNAWGGREFRCWDACTHALFTRHASGHNPREGRDERYRQRALHKFSYVAPGEDELIRCVGCGRCVVHCPVGIDIHEAVQRVAERANEERHDG
jgi:Fe-S-cluster-containing hydrogenase component 2